MTTLIIRFHHLHAHLLWQCPVRSHRQLVTANDNGTRHLRIIILARKMANIIHPLACCHEENQVVRQDFLIAVWHNRVSVALNRHHVETMSVHHTDFLQRMPHEQVILVFDFLIVYRVTIVHLHTEQNQVTRLAKLPSLSSPGIFRRSSDVLGCQQFRIDETIHTHLVENLQILIPHVFIVIHTSHRPFGPHLLCQHGNRNVLTLVRCHGNKQVCLSRTCILEHTDARRVSRQGNDVERIVQFHQALLLLVHEYHIQIFFREQTSQVGSHRSCTSNNDIHRKLYLLQTLSLIASASILQMARS